MKKVSMMIAIREALSDALARDPSVFLMGEDIATFGGCFGVTRGLLERYGPDRVRNTPISENSVVGVGVGAALMGLRPIVEIMFMDFITLAMDQLVNHAAKFHYMYDGQVCVPMVLRVAAGGGRGYGATHSQVFDAWLLSVPGIKVVAPAFPNDAKWLLRSAIEDNNPVVFIESKVLYSYADYVEDDAEPIPLGKARVVRTGDDVTVVCYSRMVHQTLRAAELLAADGIAAEVVDLRTLYPLDIDTVLASVRKTRRVLVVEEGVKRWGVGAEISCRIHEECFSDLLAPVNRIGSIDIPIPCASTLEDMTLPTAKDIEAACRCMVANN